MPGTDYENLTDEQAVKLAREGDEEAMNFLMAKYKGMVSARSRLYHILGADQADVLQEGMIGLFKAIRSYLPGKNASFKTYAAVCVNRRITDAVRASSRKKHMPLNTFVSIEERHDISGDAYDAVGLEEVIESVVQEKFSDMEKQVWKLYMQGMPKGQIAQVLGKETKSIYNTMERIKKKVKAALL